MGPIITTLIVIGIIVAAIAGGVFFVRYKLNRLTREYLGKGLGETASMLKQGLKEEASLPKSVSNMTAVFKPKLLRDFPETSYAQIEEMARNTLLGFLDAISEQNTAKLFAPSRNLTKQAQSRIDGNSMRGTEEKFSEIKIHKTSMSGYKSEGGVADAEFEISFQAMHGGKEPEQLRCKVVLNSGRAEAEETGSAVFSMNCPNCGAPLKLAGKNSVCTYCGTGVSERGTRVWLADSVTFT